MHHWQREPIAIVGIGCRLPGNIRSPQDLWQLLRSGGDATSDVPGDRWDAARFYDPSGEHPNTVYTRRGGFLDGFDRFDPAFFGYAPREVQVMDPQQRLLLETTWEAMEDAGLPPADWEGRRVGVYVGLFTHDFEILRARPSESPLANPYSGTGSSASIAANRISHAFDFNGPSMVIDTACSSSLVAVHQARASLLAGDTDLALAGGVNLQLTPEMVITLCQARMLAPDGRCKSFDARANGYARSDGVAMVALRRLSDALRDGNPVYAVIHGSATNQDGRTPTLTMPDGDAQERAIRDALRDAGLDPGAISYVEAHGTGTPTGDPIEAAALGAVLGSARPREAPCTIGSIKSNIGHTESTAGVAGLIKAALMIHHAEIPPNIHFETPNPAIPFADLRLRVPTCPEPWHAAGGRFAGVNSFGFGGSNAHVILGEAPQRPDPVPSEGPVLLCLSARSATSLQGNARRAAEALAAREPDDLPLSALAGMLARGRSHHDHRVAVAAPDRATAIAALRAAAAGTRHAGLSTATAPAVPGKLAFVFSGMGQQWWAMGRGLRRSSPVFAETLKRIDALRARHTREWSLLAELEADAETSRIDRTDIAQPAIFALQVGLAAMWREIGIRPDLIVGHSVGEVAAAHVSGILTLEQAVAVSFHRSRLQARTAGQGAMLAIGLPKDDVARRLDAFASDVCIAAVNSPRSVTLAGNRDTLERLAALLSTEGTFARMLNVEVPYHSPAMEAIGDELQAALRDIKGGAATVPMISTVTGAEIGAGQIDAAYWYRNVREPVAFSRAVETLLSLGAETFVEIGAHPVLASALRECFSEAGVKATALPSQRRDKPDAVQFLDTAGTLYCGGRVPDLSPLYTRPPRPLFLPGYAWDHSRIWTESDPSRQQRLGLMADDSRLHPLLGVQEDSAQPRWRSQITPTRPTYLADHRVRDAVLFPAAGFIEMALAAATRRDGPEGGAPASLVDLRIERPLVLDARRRAHVTATLEPTGRLDLHASSGEETPHRWLRHLTCRLLTTKAPEMPPADLDALRRRLGDLGPVEDLYSALDAKGLQYGRLFRNLAQAWREGEEGLARIVATPEIADDPGAYLLHPAMLDACFHLLALMPGTGTYLPSSCARIDLFAAPGPEIWVHARLVERTVSRMTADLDLYDASGAPVARLQGFQFRRLEDAAEPGTLRAEHLLVEDWIAQPLPGETLSKPLPAPSLPVAAPSPDAARLEALAEVWLSESHDCGGGDAHFVRVLAEAPHLGAEVTALRHVIAALGGAESERGIEPLPAALGEPLYRDAPSARAGHDALLAALGPVLNDPAHEGGVPRVLHLNAGATTLLARVLAGLSPQRVVYRATAHPDALADDLAVQKAAFAGLGVLDAAALDAPGMAGAFDLVIVEDADAGEAGSLPERVVALLAPGGRLLLAARPAEAPVWQSMIATALGQSPGRDWVSLLDSAGLEGTARLPATALSRAALFTAAAPFGAAPRPAAPDPREPLILVLGGELSQARGLLAALQAQGAAPIAVGADDLDPEILSVLLEAGGDLAPILMDMRATGPATGAADPAQHAQTICLDMAAAIFAMIDARAAGPVSCWVVTQGAQDADGHAVTALDGAALWGYARSLANEESALDLRLVDLGADNDARDVAALARMILAPDAEDEIALRGGRRLVHRLVPYAPLRPLDGSGLSFGLRRRRRRPPADLAYLETQGAGTPLAGAVHLRLTAVGLNYKDAVTAAGLLDGSDVVETSYVGLEGAGEIIAVGPGVEGFAPGDRVYGFIESFDFPSRTLPQVIQHAPPHLSDLALAGATVVAASALYALSWQARLRAGETVLIHSATSALGLAAIQIARHIGARVLATVGTDSKRDWLTALGVEVIGSSRDATFAAAARAATGGKGVDVILSALSGALLPANLEALRVGTGRLVDVANIHYDTQLALQAMVKGVTVSGFDLKRIAELDPDLVQPLLAEVRAMLEKGVLHPLPYRKLPVDGAFDVLRRSLRGSHIGRNVIDLTDGRMPVQPSAAPFQAKADGSYLVTGGLSGLGLAMAERLVEAGARHLVLLGRRGGATPEAGPAMARMVARGASVTSLACDVADPVAVDRTIARFGADLPPLRGVFHSAGLLRDCPSREMDAIEVRAVMDPKARGGWNLHRATEGLALDFFVVVTSMANTLGNVGQTNYAAANAFLDALIHLRRARGLPGTALALGVIGGVGFVARDEALRANAQRLWPSEISADEVWSLLTRALAHGQSHPVYGAIDWQRMARVLRRIGRAPRFERLAQTGTGDGHAASPLASGNASPAERRAHLGAVVRSEVAGVLGMNAAQIDPAVPLASHGFDSLLSVELILALERQVGVTLKQGVLLRADLTLDGLIAEIEASAQTGEAAPPGPAPQAGPTVRPPVGVAALSDAEVDAMLRDLEQAGATHG